MDKKELLSLPAGEIHEVLLSQELIVQLYQEQDAKVNAKVCMALVNLFFSNDGWAGRVGPIAIRQEDGFVLDGRPLLAAIHGYLLGRGLQTVRTQIIIIK